MPRLPPPNFTMRTVLRGPKTSTAREVEMKLVKKIDISPDIEALLETPTWSVSSLLPPSARQHDDDSSSPTAAEVAQEAETATEITPEKIHHLLRLSALPMPKDLTEEQSMLKDLRSQVHFVKEVQKVNTDGIQPLVAIRDETAEHRQEQTITRGSLQEYIALEEKKGKNGTIRRRRDTYQVNSYTPNSMPWLEDPIPWSKVEDPWKTGAGKESRKMGRFFFVKRRMNEQVGEVKAPREGEVGKVEVDRNVQDAQRLADVD